MPANLHHTMTYTMKILIIWVVLGHLFSAPLFAQSPPSFKGGIIQMWVRAQGTAPQSSFMMQHLRLKGGGAPSKSVSYFFQTEYFPAGLLLLDGFVDIALSPNATLRVGQFKFRYGQDRMRDIGDLKTGDYSNIMRAIFPGSPWDIGVTWIYKSVFDLHFGILGGAGPNMAADTDSTQDIALMAEVPLEVLGNSPLESGPGRIGISLYHGRGHNTGFASAQNWIGAHVLGSLFCGALDYWFELNGRSDNLMGVSSQVEHRFWRDISWLAQADGTSAGFREYRAGLNVPFQEKTRLGAFAYLNQATPAARLSPTGIIILDTRF